MLASEEACLLEALRLVHQFVGFLNITGLFEAPHDHRIQFWVLKRDEKENVNLIVEQKKKTTHKSLQLPITRLRFLSKSSAREKKLNEKQRTSLEIP